ncbi:hypothetical protein ACLESO_11450 [Pyxidicoccus sp. 3LG]
MLTLVGAGCSTTRMVRLDTGDGPPIVHMPFVEDDSGRVALDDDEFEEAVVELARDVRPFANPLREARALFGIPERGGVYWYEGRGPRLIPQAEDSGGPRLLESYADEVEPACHQELTALDARHDSALLQVEGGCSDSWPLAAG